jgi:thioredoxin-related protein
MKRAIFFILVILTTVPAFTQVSSPITKESVKWYTIQEAEQLLKKSPRPLFIDTFTDWCGWCKKMDRETFTNPVISDILNNKFYPVKFNAEGKEKITFLGQTFINDGKSGNAHQLAVALLQGQLSYPTVVFITQENDKLNVSPVPGFRQPVEMEVLLSYFADKAYLIKGWDDYQKSFVGKVK